MPLRPRPPTPHPGEKRLFRMPTPGHTWRAEVFRGRQSHSLLVVLRAWDDGRRTVSLSLPDVSTDLT